MAQRDQPRDYPTVKEESPRTQYPQSSMESASPHTQYPPALPPAVEDRSRQPPPHQGQVTLPPMRDTSNGYHNQASYSAPPPGARPPPGANSYPARPPPAGQASLPPLQPPHPPHPPMDSRPPAHYPPRGDPRGDPRDDYYAQQRPPYDRDPYYSGSGYRGPPPHDYPRDYGRSQPPPHPDDYRRAHGPPRHESEYGRPPPGHYDEYANGGHVRGGYSPYSQPPQQGQGPMTQAAPRQRTSIACRYCRKRKIRCSGYQNAPGGRCINCTRMNQECIFQPVSSSTSAAFVHVSALQGGIAPGTPLFGAYGQPLPPGPPQGAPPGPPPPPPPSAAPPGHHYPPQQPVQNPPPYYHQPMRSPTDLHSPYAESDATSLSGRRRRRESEEGHERRPPPPSGSEEEAYRRSPVSASTSPRSQPPYYPSQQHPIPGPPASTVGTTPPLSSTGPTPPQRSPATSHSSATVGPNGQPDGVQRNGHSANGIPATQVKRDSPAPGGPGAGTSVMSVNALIDRPPAHDMDRSMLQRLR